jgi:ATP-dependent Clp protease ATP-binding subunit ClpC
MVSGGRYPFERFTQGAKKALTLAQEEAERSHHSYIGTEHLLLGLMREEEGLAAKALANLGVEIGAVRSTIQSVLGVNERIIIQQLIPTSRVKTVIEASFEEARRMGNNHVGTEHLLLGLLIEGEGIAAHVLHDLGASLPKVRGEIERLTSSGHREEQGGAPVRSLRYGLNVLREAAEILGVPQRTPPTGDEREELRRLLSQLEEAERRWRAGEDPAGDGEPGPGEVAP